MSIRLSPSIARTVLGSIEKIHHLVVINKSIEFTASLDLGFIILCAFTHILQLIREISISL